MNKQDICILHIIEQRYPRGAEIFANNLAHSLFLRGSNNIICNLYNSDSDSFTVLEGVNYLSINGRRTGITAKIGIQPSILLKLVKLIRKYKPDIIIAHGADTMKYTALAGQFYPQPLMVYKNISMASYWTDNPLKKLINSKLVRLFDAVISVSQITGEDFKKLHRISATKVFVIFNATSLLRYQALNIERERFQIRQNLGLKDKDNVLINVGSLTPEKNQGEILKLVKELAEMSPYLVLVGDGPLRKELERQAKEFQIKDRVHFAGFQSDITSFLAASDVFLLTSKSEGMPAVIIEAGVVGLPSVAYDVGGVKEIIEPETGIIVPPNNYNEFKAAVISLLKNPEKRKIMGAKANIQYSKHFNLDNTVKKYETLLFKLLSEKVNRENASS